MTTILCFILAFAVVFGIIGFCISENKGDERVKDAAITAGVGATQGCGCLFTILVICGMIFAILAVLGSLR